MPPHPNRFAFPVGSRSLTTAVGHATLSLLVIVPSHYVNPNVLLRCLSFTPQLEMLLAPFPSLLQTMR